MGFFSLGGGDAQGEPPVQEGGLTEHARQRLRAPGGGRSVFTTGLSVKEFALLRGLGPQPLAQVMGVSVVRTGWQYLPALPPGSRAGMRGLRFGGGVGPAQPPVGLSGYAAMYTEPSPQQVRAYLWWQPVVSELDVLSDAWNAARRGAIDRLRQEAAEVGAEVVVGVHLDRTDHDLGRGVIECAVSGTAIRMPGEDPTSTPILTDLSVQEYCRLRQGGFEPAGLVAATSVTFGSAGRMTRLKRARTFRRVQELEEIGEAFHAARESVRRAIGDQTMQVGGATAVGVEFSHAVQRETLELGSSLASTSRRGWHISRVGLPYRVSGSGIAKRPGWVITMHAAGTAIRPNERGVPGPPKTTIRLGAR
ncbi:MAG TPA: heavy metal-binding domain-containing protein [Solirubrobacteraceae bacterium]|nr:heavy metal-binding domain-containing protein [Solirubrobacteraceae bacterium]